MTTDNPRRRILLVADDQVTQKIAARLLEGRGHDVVVASCGREAVDAVAEQAFDVLLMELQMSDLDAFQATAAIREGALVKAVEKAMGNLK